MGADNGVVAAGIHETAVIAPGARIGKNVSIGAYTVIGENVEIDDGAIIYPHVTITGWTHIGKETKIFPYTTIGAEPQDLKFVGEKSYVYIGDRTTLRECITVHRATGEGECTRIGNDCLLMATVHIAHNCQLGNNIVMSNASMLAGHVIVEDRAVIGGMTGVHQFVKIGRRAMVGGMAKLIQDVVPYTMVDGHPARAIGLNAVGIKREGVDLEGRRALKQAYRILYRSGLNVAQAIEQIEAEVPKCEEVNHILEFLRGAERGVCRARTKGAALIDE